LSLKKWFIQAPAKLNLHLDIGAREENGFHSLRSLFQMVSLYDDITVQPESRDRINISGFPDIPLEKNLLFQCWDQACKRGLFHQGLSIKCIKRIPSGAGLGGGSSDAAALIRIMAEIEPENWNHHAMMDLAQSLGSDIPFFLGSPLALIEGRGEILHPLKHHLEGTFLIYKPEIHISSGEAYRWLDSSRENQKVNLDFTYSSGELLAMLEKGPDHWRFFNHFEERVFKRYPEIEKKAREWREEGADFVRLSGSGSALFAYFLEKSPPPIKKQNHYIVNVLDKIPTAIVV